MDVTLENPFFAWLIDMLKAIAEIRVPFLDAVRYFAMCFVALGVYPLVFKLFAKVGKKK